MKTTTCPSVAEWTEFDQGALSAARHDELMEHLDSCAECAARFEGLEAKSDRVLEQLRERLPTEVLADDSDLNVLISRAAALQQTSANAAGDTNTDAASLRRSKVEEWVPQVLAPPQGPDEMGRLAGYRVLRVLGMGGMGVVLLAEDVGLKRMVALKVMSPKVASTSARFLREAQSNAAVRHDNVVTIFQVGEDRGVPFLAMELLEGESLADRLQRQQKLPVHEALQIARETAQGLAAAHAKGLTHRDIKPDNIWLESSRLAPRDESRGPVSIPSQDSVGGANDAAGRDGFPVAERQGYVGCQDCRVKLLDFGLARAVDDDQNLTQSGAIVGTPNYLSPEQAAGAAVDARTDLFSLGVVLYEMLNGRKPFAQPSLMATLKAIGTDPPRELDADIPAEVVALVKRLLEKRPEDRFASCAEVIAAIERCQQPEPATAVAPRKVKTNRTWIATAAAAALVVMLGVIVTVKDKNGKTLLRYLVPEGGTVEVAAEPGDAGADVKVETSVLPHLPEIKSPPPESDFLPPMTPVALVQRPAKLVAKDGTPVLSWTVATAPTLGIHFAPGGHQPALSRDGRKVAEFGMDANVRVWDVDQQKLFAVLVGHTAGPAQLREGASWVGTNSRRFGPITWHPDSSRLATASRDGSVRVWDVTTGRTVFQHAEAADDLNMLSWSPDGTMLAAAYRLTQRVRLWTTADWKELKPLTGLTLDRGSLDWSPDSQTLAIGANVMLLYEPAKGESRVLPGAIPTFGQLSVRWSQDGLHLAHFDSTKVVVRQTKSFEVVHAFRNDELKDARATDFAFSPDGQKLLISWTVNNATKSSQAIYDVETGAVAQSFQIAVSGVNSNVLSVEWLPDGKTVKIGKRLLDVESQAERAKFDHFHEWSDDGQRFMATTVSSRPQVHRLPKEGGKAETLFTVSEYVSPTAFPLVWSPNGESLTTLQGDTQTLALPWRDGTSAPNSKTFPNRVQSWSPDEKLAVAGISAAQLGVWSWSERRQLHAPKLAFPNPGSHAWSPDSGKLAFGTSSGSGGQARIQVMDVTTGELREPWVLPNAPDPSVWRMAWSPEGKRIVGFPSGAGYILATDGGSVVAKLEALGSQSPGSKYYGLRKLVWTADSQRILLGGDRVILEYDANTGRLNREFDVGVSQNAFVFLEDSTVQLATPGGEVLKLNLTTGAKEPVTQVAGTPVEFSPDLKYVACDLANVRQIIRLSDRQTVVTLPAPHTLISPEGHVWTPKDPKGSLWFTSPDIAGRFVFVVQTPDGQQTLTPNEFADRYGWQNDPSKVRVK